jgi:hypothetical protein
MAGKFAVGEFFDGNRLLVNQWIFNQNGMQGRPSAFDFPLKSAEPRRIQRSLAAACAQDQFGCDAAC